MKKFLFIFLFSLSIYLNAQQINFYGQAKPGDVIVGEGKNIKSAWLNDQKLLVSKSGMFIFGFDHDAKGKQKVRVLFNNKKTKVFTYVLEKREYEIQKLHLERKYVTPPKSEIKRIREEMLKMKAARKKIGKLAAALYSTGFSYPVDSVDITSVFGSRRILNGKPHNVHNGIDFGAEEGDTIRAITDGIVRIAGSNFFYNGNFVLLDHGQGLSSVYLHMSKIIAKDGEKVKKGEPIGLIGATGRATGPHLHLGVQWYNKRIDPMCLFDMKLPE